MVKIRIYSKNDVKNISEVYVDRNSLLISVTKMREYLKDNNIEEWKKYANEKIYDKFDELRNML